MGWGEAFGWAHQSEIFTEFAAQTRFENDGARLLNIAAPVDYDAMEPFQWGGTSPFADRTFPTPDGRANLVPVTFVPRADGSRQFALRLNTGRYHDQ